MHVAVVGAGALGAVYGVRVSLRTKATVTHVVRRSIEPRVTVIESVKGGVREEASIPRVTEVPGDADVVVVTVGTEDLPALEKALAPSASPIVVLTPMLPRDWHRMRATYGDRVHAAIATVVSYAREDGVFRYWLPPAPTKIDEPRAGDHGVVVRALADAFSAAGISTRLEMGVHESGPASTCCAVPLAMASALAGSLAALSKDPVLCDLAHRCCKEGVELGKRIGRPDPATLAAPLVATSIGLRLLNGFLSEEARHYASLHFGPKLMDQHRQMARDFVEMAEARGLPHAALSELSERLNAYTDADHVAPR